MLLLRTPPDYCLVAAEGLVYLCELCWRELKLPAGPPVPDRSKDRGLTKVVTGRQVRQPVFYASSAAGVGSLNPGARQTVLWLPAG